MNQLAQAWLNAADRAAVTSSADAIDAQLRQSAETAGVPYDDNSLILIIPPLAVRYRFQAMDNLVIVAGLRVLRATPPHDEI